MLTKLKQRQIPKRREIELWARAAGRCEFDGCNRLLYKSSLTHESANISEKAHIYAFSDGGVRGLGTTGRNRVARELRKLNSIENLMLVCHDCHKIIDDDERARSRYSVELLREWKLEHERRIEVATGVRREKRSHVIVYTANIATEFTRIDPQEAQAALFPDWFPASERPVHLRMNWQSAERDAAFWSTEENDLVRSYEREVRPLLDSGPSHLSIFAMAPIPLLVKLGSLITDKTRAEVYQRHRNPATWDWQPDPEGFEFKVLRPTGTDAQPVLVFALSDRIARERIEAVVSGSCDVWELTIKNPNNDFLKSRAQLAMFREATRRIIDDVGTAHGKQTPILVFPAMPVSCAIELGRLRMPKVDADWVIYDHVGSAFMKALTLTRSV